VSTVRQKITVALGVSLGKIRIADGYATDAGLRVSEWRDDQEAVQPEEMDSIIWRDRGEEVVALTAAVHEFRLALEISGFAAPGDTTPSRARALLGDILKALGNDPTLGGGVILFLPVSTTMNVVRQTLRVASVQVSLLATYRTPAWEPSVLHIPPA
jgi:hypothetical protein